MTGPRVVRPPHYQPARELRLLGCFEALDGGVPLVLSQGAARMLAYLAVHGRTPRSVIAARLWPDQSRSQGLANVRTVLWRMPGRAGWVQTPGTSVGLVDDVGVDIDVLQRPADPDPQTMLARLTALPTEDLLPDWPDDWVTIERERLRELHVRALLTVGRALAESDEPDGALVAAYRAVQLDQLRESSHRLLVELHLAEGDYAQAHRCYEAFRPSLQAELGVVPSPRMHQLVASIPHRSAPVRRARA